MGCGKTLAQASARGPTIEIVGVSLFALIFAFASITSILGTAILFWYVHSLFRPEIVIWRVPGPRSLTVGMVLYLVGMLPPFFLSIYSWVQTLWQWSMTAG